VGCGRKILLLLQEISAGGVEKRGTSVRALPVYRIFDLKVGQFAKNLQTFRPNVLRFRVEVCVLNGTEASSVFFQI
jgi:hypothetical protein